jgi:predicted HAD superfamily Cof-like phosphohydrolase
MKNLIGKNNESGCVRGVNEDKEDYWDFPPGAKSSYPDMYNDVLAFHHKFNAHIGAKPKVPPLEVVELRRTLIDEECEEVIDALASENLAEIAKELADLIVVTLGTAVAYGIDLNPVWDLVHKSNMAKTGGGNRNDGKILKPLNWEKPDIAKEINRQRGL